VAQVLADGDDDEFIRALEHIARGMAQLAKDSGLGQERLYKALTLGAKPRYDTASKMKRALGVRLCAEDS
jgi:probable addiction module antidote protein